MENHCQDILVTSVWASQYQTSTQPKAHPIHQVNRAFLTSLGHTGPFVLLTFTDCIWPITVGVIQYTLPQYQRQFKGNESTGSIEAKPALFNTA